MEDWVRKAQDAEDLKVIPPHLSLSDLEGEGLSAVPRRVDLLAVRQRQRIVAGHLEKIKIKVIFRAC